MQKNFDKVQLPCYTVLVTFMWPYGQAVKTSPFHGGIPGSNPGRVNIWALSSAGRASALQAGGHRFEPCSAHTSISGPVVQMVRMPACHAGGRGFEAHPGRFPLRKRGLLV